MYGDQQAVSDSFSGNRDGQESCAFFGANGSNAKSNEGHHSVQEHYGARDIPPSSGSEEAVVGRRVLDGRNFVHSVSKFGDETAIARYVQEQGIEGEYKALHRSNQLTLFEE